MERLVGKRGVSGFARTEMGRGPCLARLARPASVLLAASLSALALLAPAAGAQMRQLAAKPVPPGIGAAPVVPSAYVAHPLRVKDPAAYRAQKAQAERRYRRFELRRAGGSARAAAASASRPRTQVFNGLDEPGLDAAAGQGATPPDTTGAIGPADYLEMVNSEIAVYSRETLASPPLETREESSFVGSADGTCDGQIQWDQQGQRWLYTALDCSAEAGAQELYFGWSKTPSPELSASNWCRYILPTEHSLEDYPKLGHDDSQILIGANAFEDSGEERYTGSHILVADKPAPGVTACTTPLSVGEAGAEFTPVPANIADSSATGYVTALRDSSHLQLYELGKNGEGKDAILHTRIVTVPEFEMPALVPQPGTGDVIDSSDTRLTQAVAVTDQATGEEGIWTQHTVAGPGGGPSVVRWYELSPGGPTSPRQEGTVAGPAGTFAFNGAISPADDGEDAAVIYNSGDATHLVDLRAQDRHAGTPLGSMGEELKLATSVAADEDFSCEEEHGGEFLCRWGDYAGASPDPLEAHLIWGTGELTVAAPPGNGEPQWGSRNVALDVSPSALPPAASASAATAIGETGATLDGSVNPEGRETTYRFEYGTTTAYGCDDAQAVTPV
jgi:hypothetical protein